MPSMILQRHPLDGSDIRKDGSDDRVFPKIDHSGSSARIVLEQIRSKFTKKVTSTMD